MVYETGGTQAGGSAGLSGDGPDLADAKSESAREEVTKESSTAARLRREALNKADKLRASAAHGLESAADSVHAGGERVASAAHRAGDALASGADYVRDNEVRDMVDDLAEVVRNNPGPALLCAAALGFVLGRSVYRH